jgi:tRNA pseudouridine55 synthase
LALLSKREGITSFQALGPLKRALASGKAGHSGTLDRFASGLLVALCGSYSRLAFYVSQGRKVYRGLVSFGSETDTLDPEGEVVATAPIPDSSSLEAALSLFRGPIMQRPPAYSAVHVGGRRAYQVALRGETPDIPEREVVIHSLDLESYDNGQARITVTCSSGTYIRALARDIALACGSRAYLKELARLAVGPFRLENARDCEFFDPETDLRPFRPEEAVSLGLRALGLEDGALASRFTHGSPLGAEDFSPLDSGGPFAAGRGMVFGAGHSVLGVVLLEDGKLSYERVLCPERGGRG